MKDEKGSDRVVSYGPDQVPVLITVQPEYLDPDTHDGLTKEGHDKLVAALQEGFSGKGFIVNVVIPVEADAEDVVWVASYASRTKTVTRVESEEVPVPARDEPHDEPPHGRTEPASQEPGDEDADKQKSPG